MHNQIMHYCVISLMTKLFRPSLALTGVLAATIVLSIAVVAASPLAFADQGTCSSNSGGECASNSEANGNPSNSATPEVPAGANPQPNPQRK